MLNVILFTCSFLACSSLAITFSASFAFVLYQLIYFFNPADRWWGLMIPDIRYSLISVLLMCLVLLFNASSLKQNKLFAVPQFKLVYLFLFIYIISYFTALDQTLHWEHTVYFIKLVIIISIGFKLISSLKELDYILKTYIAGSWYISYVAFDVGRNSGLRVEHIGTVDSPDANGIAATIGPALILSFYYFWRSNNKFEKLLMAISGIFIANAIILINSRGAFLAVIASLFVFVYYMFFSKLRSKNQRSLTILLVCLGLSGSLYLADEYFIERMYTIKTEENTTEKQTAYTRLSFWEAAYDMTLDDPMGKGVRSFNLRAPSYLPAEQDVGKRRSRSVHSSWFEALTEVGFIGLFIMLYLIWHCFKSLRACKKALFKEEHIEHYYKVIAIEAAFICYLVSMSFINRIRAETFYWLILFIAIAYNLYCNLKLQHEEKT